MSIHEACQPEAIMLMMTGAMVHLYMISGSLIFCDSLMSSALACAEVLDEGQIERREWLDPHTIEESVQVDALRRASRLLHQLCIWARVVV